MRALLKSTKTQSLTGFSCLSFYARDKWLPTSDNKQQKQCPYYGDSPDERNAQQQQKN